MRIPWPALFGLALLFSFAAAAAAALDDPGAVDRAWERWRVGKIEPAHRLAATIVDQDPGDNEARHLLVLTSMVRGRYEEGLAEYALLDPAYDRLGELNKAVIDSLLLLGRADQAASFARRRGSSAATIRWLERRSVEPLRVTLDATTVVPFSEDNALRAWMPAVPIVINGRQLLGHLDTGGTFVAMSPKMAAELGIEVELVGTGFANNQETTVEMGLVERLELGDAVLEGVPTAVLAALQGALPTGDGIEDMVILGTNVLQQFLTTWDNDRQRLVLSPRRDPESRKEHFEHVPTGGTGIDFFMLPDHFLFARGSVAGHELPLFVDTGLVALDSSLRQAGIMASAENLRAWGLTIADSESGFVHSPGPVRLGPLEEADVLVKVGDWSLVRHGLELPALVGYGFLADTVWSIDFDRQKWYFSTPESAPSPPEMGTAVARETVEADLPATPDLERAPAPVTPPPRGTTGDLAELVGTYEVALGVGLTVTSDDERLYLLAPGQPRFALEPQPGGRYLVPEVGATVEFERDETGGIGALLLHQDGRTTRATRRR